MPRSTVLSTTTTNTRKRKSTGGLDAAGKQDDSSNKRRKTLDAFFAPQVTMKSPTKEGKVSMEVVALNTEQRRVLQMVVDEGKNVFFTGPAGSGKSLLLRAIIAGLKKKYSKNQAVISVTASTGMAASNIGGMTIHSWGAVTPGMHNIDRQISCIKTCKPAFKRWRETKVLVIDEVSMVDGELFDTLTKLADQLRNKKTDRPFGGIQLVVTGDFFQLPPVTKSGVEPFFAFESESWKKCIDHTVTLTEVYRQKDTQFVDLLNELRKGNIAPSAHQTFTSLSRPLPPLPSGILPTELYPLRAQVERANTTRLAALPGSVHAYVARDTGTHQKVLEQMVVPARLAFKVDAQVMLVKNVDEKLVNGSVGRVLGFHAIATCAASVGTLSSSQEKDMKPFSGFGLGSSGSKPKSGSASTSSSQESNASASTASSKANGAVRNVQVGADGRTPVALCGKTLADKENAGAEQADIKPASAKGKPRDDELYPLVEFRTQQGTEVVLVVRDEFRVEDNEGKLLARRVQVPLVLAWAMSIHKSQGQTIQHVKIDLRSVFEKGQSYVALSRAASLDGLQVLGFDPKKVKAHPKVVEWSSGLEVAASVNT
ncbi:PIF1-like helicase-domain-containing protein [Ganoderma leucocontextum]|nr:PIF1-like helicase-domain-containing protein [Ganoderma leucocontextum]